MKNALNWFEIPTNNLAKSQKFYETILSITMMPFEEMGMKSAFFESDLENGVGGCLIEGRGYVPTEEGSLVYLNAGDDLAPALNKVEAAGGKILIPKTSLGQHGFMAHFLDIDGNKIGLHSIK